MGRSLKKKKLKEFVEFIPGINSSRVEAQLEEEKITYYDQSSFDEDYLIKEGNHQTVSPSSKIESEGVLIKNDIVISNTLQKATLVHERNIGKILSLNFMKVAFKNGSLDKNYFLYLFNAYPDIQRQKERELQGTGPVRKLTKRSLENLEAPIVTLVEQQKIGAIYVETLKLQSKLTTYASMLEQFAGQVIEKSLEE